MEHPTSFDGVGETAADVIDDDTSPYEPWRNEKKISKYSTDVLGLCEIISSEYF